MGQFALGIRSLLVKATVFVVMAALLAWALGGTLFPKPSRASLGAAEFEGASWFWRLSVGGERPGTVQCELMRQVKGQDASRFLDGSWTDVKGPVIQDGVLYVGGRPGDAADWRVVAVSKAGEVNAQANLDALGLEAQFARLQAGLPLADAGALADLRRTLLDLPAETADERR